MMKKLLCGLLTVTMLGACLWGCGSKGEEPAKDAGTTQEQGGGAETATGTEPAEAAGDAEVVTYYCAIGAYLETMKAEVDNWNQTVGKEKNIYIQLTSDIDNYGTNLTAMMQSGNYPDLYDYAYDYTDFSANGWNYDLSTIDELSDLIARFEPYLVDGVNYHDGRLVGLPLEVIPVKFAVNLDLFEKNNLELPKTWDDVVECAKVITENGDGVDYGYGFTWQWSGGIRRLAMKSCYSSTGVSWWDNGNAKYDFTPFKKSIEAHQEMYENGYMFPDPSELSIDGIRSKFAEGHVGMITAYGYDIGVYNDQFPAQCNWTIIDCPTYEEGEAPYKGVYLNRSNVGITIGVTEEHLPAVVEVFKFLHSEELYSKLYSVGAIIPHESSIMESTEMAKEVKNWEEMSDLTNYAPLNLYPDNLLTVEGDNYNTVFQAVIMGAAEFDDVVSDLNDRYNAAYQQLKDSGDLNLEAYEKPYTALQK